ncbi:hemolysin family protein [Geodermatophilus sabuli]|uniref:Hemolysin, contains CBS domains n=1 Tax=Geodermatophilus sabuli TaxID=1564158 RepID=A0A285EJU3_9ACTN|nr:hemolysin family protein [Geodermatophilus sabuli]MBB3086953.1 CBS domain containing-hemolysin-like protein [Geodermatophilus sabuli]SNX99267.1 Hemolysin, contains CBS domains [Geodermatophilus sabuli]
MTEWLLVGVGVLLVLACAGFVAFEFALVTVDRATVEREVDAGRPRAAGVLSAMQTLSTQLSGAQLGITVTNLAIGFVAEPSIAALLEGPLASLGLSGGAARSVSITLALVLATALTMVFGELVPKNLAISAPLGVAKRVSGFQRGFTRSTALVIRVLNGWANGILRRLFGVEPQEELASARSPEELTSLVRRSRTVGTLPAGTATLLERGLAFGELRASDVATPRIRMTTVAVDAPVADVLTTARESGHSRFPVVSGAGADDVVGMVHVKHALAVARDERGRVPVERVMVPPRFVPTSRQLDELLVDLRRGGLQMAVVVDEYGGTDGLVTVEDLVEELVGAVSDEHDEDEEQDVVDRGDGTWSVSGLLRPDEVSARTGLAVPADRHYETIGGLVLHRLGRIPEPGDRVTALRQLPTELAGEAEGHPGGVWVQVESLDGTRVDRALVGALTGEDREATDG